ncbi:J domain-containing protein [Actinospongicola halichondriae]|uniref:J domain-containing protein n=1 Tax=Actinospongicola halichondriae TaxID=3236844 RepID=UPI003D3AE609
MAMRKRWDRKRRERRPDAPVDTVPDRRDPATRPHDDELSSRLDAVSSRFVHPPSPEELRAAFGRRPVDEAPAPRSEDFVSSFPAETLFVPTIDDPVEIPSEVDDRSRTRGDYYYDPDDAWAVLGVRPGASWSEITAAHRRLAKVHHPDRLLDASDEHRATSEASIRDINVAYSVLRRLTGN